MLVPLLVTSETCAALERPESAPKLLVVTRNSCKRVQRHAHGAGVRGAELRVVDVDAVERDVGLIRARAADRPAT